MLPQPRERLVVIVLIKATVGGTAPPIVSTGIEPLARMTQYLTGQECFTYFFFGGGGGGRERYRFHCGVDFRQVYVIKKTSTPAEEQRGYSRELSPEPNAKKKTNPKETILL